ncbi:hypothetical protein [uncultured Apibacter sp.]
MWKSREATTSHSNTKHFKDFLKSMEGKYDSLYINYKFS